MAEQQKSFIKKCGEDNMHWYEDGAACTCGQVPQGIFFASNCSCGAFGQIYPRHSPDCAYVAWANRRNAFIVQHPELIPPLDLAVVKLNTDKTRKGKK